MTMRSGEPDSGIAVAEQAALLLGEPKAAADWWPAVRAGTARMVSVGAGERAADRQLLAHLLRAGCGRQTPMGLWRFDDIGKGAGAAGARAIPC